VSGYPGVVSFEEGAVVVGCYCVEVCLLLVLSALTLRLEDESNGYLLLLVRCPLALQLNLPGRFPVAAVVQGSLVEPVS